jgi:hypothetical protein
LELGQVEPLYQGAHHNDHQKYGKAPLKALRDTVFPRKFHLISNTYKKIDFNLFRNIRSKQVCVEGSGPKTGLKTARICPAAAISCG